MASDEHHFVKEGQPAARQFSLRSLFKLTLAAALALMLIVLCRDSPPKGSFGIISVWTFVSCLPAAGVLFVWRREIISSRWLALFSIGIYALSLVLPTLGELKSADLGFVGAYGSVIMTPEAFHQLSNPPNPGGWFVLKPMGSMAIICGGSANLLFICGYAAACLGMKWPRWTAIARWAGLVALVLGITAAFLLMADTDWPTILPGCGMWLAAFLAFVLGTLPLRDATASK